jgi:hypothetical protein
LSRTSVKLMFVEPLNLEDFTAKRFDFVGVRSRGLHEKHAVETWNLGTISTFT